MTRDIDQRHHLQRQPEFGELLPTVAHNTHTHMHTHMHTLTQTISVGESGTLVAISFMNVLLIRCRVTRDNTCRTGPVDDGLVKDCGEIIQATGYLCAKNCSVCLSWFISCVEF